MKVPFSPPRIDERTLEAVAGVLRSGWITTGPQVRHFEERLTEYTGCRATVCLNSASAGLELAL
ncbi:MAG TPA: DegT/DnrJ/EryC1/StrS family aminotransferase, partial [Bacteroidales bacterium]|nr:DegT/DnrJ/EryC1/StrS family aminotransferase [Bacteroidales bacterium]